MTANPRPQVFGSEVQAMIIIFAGERVYLRDQIIETNVIIERRRDCSCRL